MTIGARLREHPHLLERAYGITLRMARAARPLGTALGRRRLDAMLRPLERAGKGLVFDCRMCGQCVLHATGMTCPMTCPKSLRNGPCGGVRQDGSCETDAAKACVWLQAWRRAAAMPDHGDGIREIQAPLDHRRAGSASWTEEILGPGEAAEGAP